jgi:hypothetical protein
MKTFDRNNICPIITEESLNDYKQDDFYKNYMESINLCKKLSLDDMELKHLTAYAEKGVEFVFFAKHNCCEFVYDLEEVLDSVIKPLSRYLEARYDIKLNYLYS